MKLLFVLSLLAIPGTASAACEAVQAGDLAVSGVWSRASIGTSRPGVVYVTIRNDGVEDDTLTGIATPAAAMPMLHESVMEDGIATMPHVMAIPVPAGATVALEPGGLHAMLMDLTAPLKEGGTFPVTLTFERAGPVTVEAEILSLASQGPDCG
ncbi:copper chaperone PCu(A)C [Paracoccus stylophorae]|uniref:Copper chaperone PCu(A)C n=1 Tax=Paracoccus stylophorae TaxID=659350 RepID=A0ABY7SSI1_9RHOB|nr:copper chaperone PCu(A)C [Paracoccus stylophorae]WCR09836.1 copper chaperone PCu(A)C [Paracoccus stylophorae]